MAAVILYAKAFPARDTLGKTGFTALVGLEGIIWVSGHFRHRHRMLWQLRLSRLACGFFRSGRGE